MNFDSASVAISSFRREAWPALARFAAPGRPKLSGLLRYGRTLPGAYFLRRGLFLPEELPAVMGRDAAAAGLAGYDPVADSAGALAATIGGNGHAPDAWTAVHELETARYMRNQLLRDADWASMASSVELRVPFVDAWLRRRLAAHGFEPARGRGKAELVRRAAPELPAALFARLKHEEDAAMSHCRFHFCISCFIDWLQH